MTPLETCLHYFNQTFLILFTACWLTMRTIIVARACGFLNYEYRKKPMLGYSLLIENDTHNMLSNRSVNVTKTWPWLCRMWCWDHVTEPLLKPGADPHNQHLNILHQSEAKKTLLVWNWPRVWCIAGRRVRKEHWKLPLTEVSWMLEGF